MRYLSIVSTLAVLAGLSSLPRSEATPADEDWGTIKGQIVWGGGNIPQRKVIEKVNGNQDQNHCLSKGPLLDEEWVVNKDNKGVRWTFVWLAPEPPKAGEKPAKLPIHPDLATINAKDKDVTVDQPCCQFIPHVVALREGQNLVVKNSAPVPHNVKWTGGLLNQGNNVILPPGKSRTIDDLVTDKYPVNFECNIHPWMKGVVRIYDHPYFAVTDADGNFEIKKAPKGKYRLVIWHDSMGYRGGREGRDGTEITIKGGGVTDLGKYDLKPDK